MWPFKGKGLCSHTKKGFYSPWYDEPNRVLKYQEACVLCGKQTGNYLYSKVEYVDLSDRQS